MAPVLRALSPVALASLILAGYRLPGPQVPPVSTRRLPEGGLQPQVATTPDGTIHLVYFLGGPRRGDLFYVRSSDGGANLSRPVRVNTTQGSAIAIG